MYTPRVAPISTHEAAQLQECMTACKPLEEYSKRRDASHARVPAAHVAFAAVLSYRGASHMRLCFHIECHGAVSKLI